MKSGFNSSIGLTAVLTDAWVNAVDPQEAFQFLNRTNRCSDDVISPFAQ